MRMPLLCAVTLVVSLTACQFFTAGESVSPPDLAKARASAARPGARGGHGAEARHEGMPADHPPLERVTVAHILIRYKGAARTGDEFTRSKQEAKALAELIAIKAKAAGADFSALANEHTEDPSGKGKGGLIGPFVRGRMVPSFEEAAFGLPVGGVSDVVESAFGFHIIHRLQ